MSTRPEITRRTIEQAQQTAAKVAGFTYLFALAAVVFAQFGIHGRLFVEGNAAETARNIMAHEQRESRYELNQTDSEDRGRAVPGDAQYGTPNLAWFFGTKSGGVESNPCTPNPN